MTLGVGGRYSIQLSYERVFCEDSKRVKNSNYLKIVFSPLVLPQRGRSLSRLATVHRGSIIPVLFCRVYLLETAPPGGKEAKIAVAAALYLPWSWLASPLRRDWVTPRHTDLRIFGSIISTMKVPWV